MTLYKKAAALELMDHEVVVEAPVSTEEKEENSSVAHSSQITELGDEEA